MKCSTACIILENINEEDAVWAFYIRIKKLWTPQTSADMPSQDPYSQPFHLYFHYFAFFFASAIYSITPALMMKLHSVWICLHILHTHVFHDNYLLHVIKDYEY